MQSEHLRLFFIFVCVCKRRSKDLKNNVDFGNNKIDLLNIHTKCQSYCILNFTHRMQTSFRFKVIWDKKKIYMRRDFSPELGERIPNFVKIKINK